jgi:NADPH2 dehydrogenase
MNNYRRVAALKTSQAFTQHLAEIGADLAFDAELQSGPAAPLAQSYRLPDGMTLGNRFSVLPMEGWDGTTDGAPIQTS